MQAEVPDHITMLILCDVRGGLVEGTLMGYPVHVIIERMTGRRDARVQLSGPACCDVS